MKNNAVQNNEGQSVISDQAFKVTALQYVKEALFNEEFEDCERLIDIAKKFGAQQGEINAVITAYIRGDKAEAGGGQSEANQGKNRLFK